MNGWKRIGLVITVFWVILLAGYAGYERTRLPVQFFGEETVNPGYGFAVARDLYFVDLNSGSRNLVGFVAATNRAVKASSEEERKIGSLPFSVERNSFI